MSFVTLLVLAFGGFVSLVVMVGVLLVGLTEAADTDHARSEDLSEMERTLVGREPGAGRRPQG